MSRLEGAVQARAVLGEDFFGGWDPSDAELCARYATQSEATEGKITDFLGIKTNSRFHPWAQHLNNKVVGELPIPDDSLRAEAIEYFAVLKSLEAAPPSSFSVIEVGASYAPWTCVAAVLAKRTGRYESKFVAVEASKYLFDLIPAHLGENDIRLEERKFRLINGAVSVRREVLQFPKVSNPGENGGQVSKTVSETDYLGRAVEYEAVQGYPIPDLMASGIYDLLHVDIQGMEHDVLSAAMRVVNEQARAVFVGTHSRKIEGQLLELFHANGWKLERERPTKFAYCASRSDIVGWTTRDGGQYWTNPRKLS
jgi:FkbM family methyltransferase